MSRIAFVFAVLLGAAFSAPSQTTRPASDQGWPKAMGAFAKALVGGDLEGMEKVMSARTSVRRFDGTGTEEAWRLFERIGKPTLVGQHAYMHPPMVMAADVAADFKNAAAVPEKAKSKYLVEDETEMKRANATAAQWVGEQLTAKHGAPVGVVVLWTPRPTPPGATEPPGYDTVFILCKGEEVAPRKFKITTVVYGNPVQE